MVHSVSPVVLVVEDEPLVRMFAVDVLEEGGFAPLEASDAEEAIRIIDEHHEIRLLFTDIDMPGRMDGLALAEQVKAKRPRIEVIITSGKRHPPATAPSPGDFLPKPYTAREVLRLAGEKLRHGPANA